MTRQLWTFEAFDTLFFRESRPMETVGGTALGSVFPPSPRTVIGAIRNAVGTAHHVNWADYAGASHPLHAIIGKGDDLGPLSFGGPYLFTDKKPLYPMPLAVLWSSDKQTRLQPAAKPTETDLGWVRLPDKCDPKLIGASPKEQDWLTLDGLKQFLEGEPIDEKNWRAHKSLVDAEPRLGIGRDNQTGTVKEGLLYQTQHIRPRHSAGLSVGMTVNGLNTENLPEHGVSRLGGEGRPAGWQRNAATAITLPVVQKQTEARGLVLLLLTPARFAQGWLPDGFVPVKKGDTDCWQGELGGIRLTLLCAVTGKPVREGGWDLVGKQPRALQSLVPAGSCYFCEVEGDMAHAQGTLHGLKIGADTVLGRGEIAVGYW